MPSQLAPATLEGWFALHQMFSMDWASVREAGFAFAADAEALFAVLERQVLPTYYDDRARWIALMRNSIAQLGARFNTNRMLVEYVDGLYLPAHRDLVAELTAA